MRKEIYSALTGRLKRLIRQDDGNIVFVSPEELEEMENANQTIDFVIKHFGLWNENRSFAGMEQSAGFPACLLEFMPVDWEPLSRGVRMANMVIRLHIITKCTATTESEDRWNEELDSLDLPDRINRVMHAYSDDRFGSFSGTASITNHNHDMYIDHIEEFTASVKDNSAEEVFHRIRIPIPKFSTVLKNR